jgi:hypothetical protein
MILLNGDTIFRQKILSFSCFLLLPQCQTNLRIVHWSLPRIKSLEQFLNYYISSVNCGNIYIHSVLLYGKFIRGKKVPLFVLLFTIIVLCLQKITSAPGTGYAQFFVWRAKNTFREQFIDILYHAALNLRQVVNHIVELLLEVIFWSSFNIAVFCCKLWLSKLHNLYLF